MSEIIRWRCRRGMLELDVIFHRFFDARYANLSEALQTAFVALQKIDDPLLFDWLVAGVACPKPALQSIVNEMRSFFSASHPIA